MTLRTALGEPRIAHQPCGQGMTMAADPYVYPGTDVLRNHLGIRDPAQLQAAEANSTGPRIALLRLRSLPGRYDLGHLQAFHRAIFSGIYPWAGEIRAVAIAKSHLFALPQHIGPYLGYQLAKLATEHHLRGLDQTRFIDRLTYYFAEVNAVHPFREGNGRTQRAFFSQLARAAGYKLAWERLDAEANIEAAIASLNGDNSKLAELLGYITEALD